MNHTQNDVPVNDHASANGREQATAANANRLIALLKRHFFNRVDLIAFRPPWNASACPAIGDNLDDLLAAHLDANAPQVELRWKTVAGKSGTLTGRFRLGTYSPAKDGTTLFAVLDFDGDAHHKPLADPFAAALRIMHILREKGIVAHLEMSGSATGWHVWIFFSEPVSAAKVRQLLFALVPKDIPLANGKGTADPKRGNGVEVFPKQDIPPEVGNQVWLPWFHGAKPGGNQFYNATEDGEVTAYMPDSFETVTPANLEAVLATIPPPKKKTQPSFTRMHSSGANGGGRPTADFMVDWALRRSAAGKDEGRNSTGSELARQLRDNRFSKAEAENIVREYARKVSQDGHAYTEREAVASVHSAYSKPAREPWQMSEQPIPFTWGKKTTANGHQPKATAAEDATDDKPSNQEEEAPLADEEPKQADEPQADTAEDEPKAEAEPEDKTEQEPEEEPPPETEQATENEQPADEAIKVREAIDDAHRLARLFRDDFMREDWNTLWYWRTEWYRWDGTAYRLLPVEELRGELSERIKQEFDDRNRQAIFAWEKNGQADDKGKATPAPVARKVTGRLVSDALQALAGMSMLPGALTAPAWLGMGQPFPAEEVLSCNNTLIHLPTWANGAKAAFPMTPAFFTVNALDYGFDPDALPADGWLSFLRQLWPNDPQAIAALQEWFGYMLLPDTSQHKILMIVGPKRSGKGTIARVLRAMIGLRNCCSPTLASLGTNFGLWPLLGKTLAVISDARLSGRTDAAVVVEHLLSISGEDEKTVDRKNMPPVTTKLNVRFMILTNELPRVTDPSGAFVGRLVILRQTESFYGKEEMALTARLLTELPQILLWSMQGWKRLRERGHFEQPKSGRRLVENMEDLASPIGAFVKECCELGPAFEVFARDLYRRWCVWCGDVGSKEPGTEAAFGRDLRASLAGLDDRKPRLGGERLLQYLGIRIRASDAAGPDEEPF